MGVKKKQSIRSRRDTSIWTYGKDVQASEAVS